MSAEQSANIRVSSKPPRRAAYALPTLFTSGNILMGFVAILQTFEGALEVRGGNYGNNDHFALAAKLLGFAVFFDGLDGRIARATNTVSDFGREMDSLADVITFGMAPAVLAFVWGVLFVTAPTGANLLDHLSRAGYILAFFYLLCGAVRLARFNVQTNPMPKNPGRPNRKYFVGMPIPAAAGFIAAVVFVDPSPVSSFWFSTAWLVLLGIVSLLMVSSWRYPSFKQISIAKPHTSLMTLLIGGIVISIWAWPQPVLLTMAITYVSSGILIRAGGLIKRHKRTRSSTSIPEHQIG